MNTIHEPAEMLEFISQPAMLVKDGIIIQVNQAAAGFMIHDNTPLDQILMTGAQEYEDFTGGCLYLTLDIAGQPCPASVTRLSKSNNDIVIVAKETGNSELQAMALAAQELRIPLSDILATAERSFTDVCQLADPPVTAQLSRINRNLYQMLRIISNMSDSYRYTQEISPKVETREIGNFLEEILEKATPLIRLNDITLSYDLPKERIYCQIDAEKLERAVYNILSNSMKYTPRGGTIHVSLLRKGTILHLSVQDSGTGIPEQIQSSFHNRFQRQPTLENSINGIGLGMVMIRAAAAVHGGTVLIRQEADHGTRITLTLKINQSSQPMVRSDWMRVDYAGERDHSLIELSESLPDTLYAPDNLS